MKSLKIAHIVSTFPPYRGGIGNVCYYQVMGLAEKKYDVTVFTPKYDSKEVSDTTPLVRVQYLTPLFHFGNAALVPQILFKLKDFDIIHIHFPFIGVESLLLIKLFNKKAKIVLQYQMDLVGKGVKAFLFTIFNKAYLPLILRLANVVLVSSIDYLKNSLIHQYSFKNPQKFFELANGVDLLRFYPEQVASQILLKNNPEKKRILLFVGGLDKAHYFKGLAILFHALVKVSNVKLFIVGDGDQKQQYVDLAVTLGVQQNILFCGSVSDEGLREYYNMCDALVLPSVDKTEAFGLVLLEAMACGKTVIASDLPGVRTVVRNNENGLLVQPNNIDDLAIKIQQILDNPKLKTSFGEKSLVIAKEHYSWPHLISRLERVYTDIMEL